MLTFPKDTAQISWTRHIKNKMMFYHLSGAQIMRIFRKPDRREEGIAPGTSAAMKTVTHNVKLKTDSKKPQKTEIWMMYKINSGQKNKITKSKFTMISAWRYPGVTKPGERPEIPEDILQELEKIA